MDLEKYLDKYNNVSREELEKIRDSVSVSAFNEMVFESKVRSLYQNREKEKRDGRPALQPGPLIHVLSVSVQPQKDGEGKPLAIYGRIFVEFRDSIYGGMIVHDLYKRERTAVEVLGTSGTLTLNGPDNSCWPYHAYMPLFENRINVELFDGANNVFARKCFSLENNETEDDYEQVKSTFISSEQGTLTLHYIEIPFGVLCRVEVMFYNRQGSNKDEHKHRFVNVNGNIVARYGNTYGNYDSEECTLFEKQSNEFERVEIDHVKSMQLSRCWVALPVYSSLVVGVDLSEFETGRKIVNGTVELLAQPGSMFGDSFVLDDIIIQVRVAWFSPTPLGPCRGDDKSSDNICSSLTPDVQGRHEEESDMDREDECSPSLRGMPKEEMDIEEKDESTSSSSDDDDDESNDESPYWALHPHKSKPLSSPAVEIFSVFIGLEKSEAVQIYGSIEVLNDDHAVYIFKRGEKDALGISEHMKSTPILDDFRDYEECDSLVMKFDIKDVEGRLVIKGYVDWAASVLESALWLDKQLCSVIQGEHGFAAVHYSIFPRAVEANIKVFLKLKMGSPDVYPNIYGSLIAQYSHYDYSSRYNRDYYRSVLFRRIQDDSIPLNADWTVPLSRSMIVVPSYSSLIINVDLSSGIPDQRLSCAKEIVIGERRKTIETHDCFLYIEIEWCEVKSAATADPMETDKSESAPEYA